jgi:glycosyltransferase involved in cell wall biosynthesis
MSSSVDIAIIVTSFNLENHIERCLTSLFNQTLDKTRYQIIVSDDCSTDQTLPLIKKLIQGQSNVMLIESAHNTGPGPARNRAFAYVDARYVVFVDGDDCLTEKALEILLATAKQTDADLIYYNYALYEIEKNEYYAKRKDLSVIAMDAAERTRQMLAADLDGSVIFSLFKWELITANQIVFPKGLHEDISFIFHASLQAKKIAKCDEAIYIKNFRRHSIINRLEEAHITGLLNAWLACWNIFQYSPLFDPTLFPSFQRGFVGCVASIIEKTQAFFPANAALRHPLYLFLSNTLAIVPANFKWDFKAVSRQDNLVRLFIDLFVRKNRSQQDTIDFEVAAKKFARLEANTFVKPVAAV